ncbi:3-methyladenine DNA glycosylase [Zafaria sp. J156]|uniref:3-methyladenine DNA glycosylase n=1 Tax=Zafaria sp. J156 TaxID=3116490 RepID=UPI003D35D8A4
MPSPADPATARTLDAFDAFDVLGAEQWRARERAHAARVERFAAPFIERRHAGRKHPVEDFLFTYYTQKPGQLQRWHPGAGVVLLDAADTERAGWKFYRTAPPEEAGRAGSGLVLDAAAFLEARREAVDFARVILAGTAARPAQLSCFGLHEWAMAYRSEENGIRHEYLPLRLGAGGTDRVVEEHRIRCTHFDAFRFYAPQAAPLNELQPTRETQRELEQPGCLHANMDLYKWAYKLTPAIHSELVMDCFELAWEIRTMDMQASPYDLAEWGYEPLRIETPAGKARYVELQRGFAERAQELRGRLLDAVEHLAGAARPVAGSRS